MKITDDNKTLAAEIKALLVADLADRPASHINVKAHEADCVGRLTGQTFTIVQVAIIGCANPRFNTPAEKAAIGNAAAAAHEVGATFRLVDRIR